MLNWLAILNAIQLLPGAPLVPVNVITLGLLGIGVEFFLVRPEAESAIPGLFVELTFGVLFIKSGNRSWLLMWVIKRWEFMGISSTQIVVEVAVVNFSKIPESNPGRSL